MLSEVADVCMIPASNANFFATLRHAVRLRVSSGLESDRSREDIYNERVLRLASWGGRAVGTDYITMSLASGAGGGGAWSK